MKDDRVVSQPRGDTPKMPLLKLTPDDLARDAKSKGAGINTGDVVNAQPGAPLPETGGGGKGGGDGKPFHKRIGPDGFAEALSKGARAVRRNLAFVMVLTLGTNVLILSIPIYLFQISDRVLTSRSVDTLIMLTVVIVGAVVVQTMLDAVRRFILMRSAVEVAVQLGAPILSAAAHASLHSGGKEY